jgi:hypothetical protein
MVYLVVACSGEYSDYREDVVYAYADEALAEEHARLAGEWYDERWDADDWVEGAERLAAECPYCSVESDYTGIWFRVESVELRDALPVAE